MSRFRFDQAALTILTGRRPALFVLGLAQLGMLLWTWGTWPDVLVDFGREIYVPWRLAEGDVLYRDVAYFNGPLSPYFNALVFRALGASILSLVTANILLTVIALILIYEFIRHIADELAAFVASLLFVFMFSSTQLTVVANYNFIMPYSHEMTHGFVLAMGCLHAFRRLQQQPTFRWALAVGMLVGLTFLTKSEHVVALTGAVVVGLWLEFTGNAALRVRAPVSWAGVLFGLLAGVGVTMIAAVVLLTVTLDITEALKAVTSTVRHLFNEDAVSLAFYRHSLGIDAPFENLRASAWTLLWWILAAGLLVGIGVVVSRSGVSTLIVSILVFSAVLLALLGTSVGPPLLFDFGRPLTLFTAGTMIALSWACLSPRYRLIDEAKWRLALIFAVFAFAMLGKMVLNPRIVQYGFVLALPATLLVVAASMSWLPRALPSLRSDARILRSGLLAAFTALVIAHLDVASGLMQGKTFSVGDGRDAFLADARGVVVESVVDNLAKRISADASVAVVPNGATINYLLRRANSTPYVVLLPPEFIFFGEDEITEAYRTAPPDYILLLVTDTSTFGRGTFGDG